MKKKIGYIPVDSALEVWLMEKLMKEPPKSECTSELLSGIKDMLSGELTTLVLSISDDTDISSITSFDKIQIGELEINPKGRRV